MTEYRSRLIARTIAPIQEATSYIINNNKLTRGLLLTAAMGGGLGFLAGCKPPHNPYANPELGKISASNASTSDEFSRTVQLAREKQADPRIAKPFTVDTRRGVIGQEYGKLIDPGEDAPQSAADVQKVWMEKPAVLDFLLAKGNIAPEGLFTVDLWDINRPGSAKTTVTYKEFPEAMEKLSQTEAFKEYLAEKQAELVEAGILKEGESIKMGDFSKKALQEKYGRYGKQLYLKDGEPKWVEIEMLDQSTNEALNIYSTHDKDYFISVAITNSGEVLPLLQSQDCGGQCQPPAPPRVVYPTPTPLRQIFPSPTFTATPTEVLPPLPTLPPFLTFTPTFQAPPPGGGGGETPVPPTQPPTQPSSTPAPEASLTPQPRPADTPIPRTTPLTPVPTAPPGSTPEAPITPQPRPPEALTPAPRTTAPAPIPSAPANATPEAPITPQPRPTDAPPRPTTGANIGITPSGPVPGGTAASPQR